MKLEEIGFYTLSDKRASEASEKSDLQRCELILTSRCNFKCPYCRGIRKDYDKELSFEEAKHIVDIWTSNKLHNIRFSGGEPTVWRNLPELVAYTKNKGVEHIALSTNGSQPFEYYKNLIDLGINDFSISLDACCSDFGDKMAGGINGIFEKIKSNIEKISKLSYVSVGVVITEETISTVKDVVVFAHNLGVKDIRIIPSAQYNKMLETAKTLNEEILNSHPILKYRVENIKNSIPVRGIEETDARRCPLALDDMVVVGDHHFPCIIHMREQGNPIGKVGDNIREERKEWFLNHNCYEDKICQNNCLDVCVEYNNKWMKFTIDRNNELKKINSSLFTREKWNAGSVHSLGIEHFRFENLKDHSEQIKKFAYGWCFAEDISFRPKENHVAIMCQFEEKEFWFHIRNNEFFELFCR
jgi:molybdenum cofactor biosynthesis enzyme MoaA